jgi:hypothetical protein
MGISAMIQIVLAKASRGEPLKRMFMGVGERVFYLAHPERIAAVEAGETDPIGFPQEDVFEFEERLYTTLRAEWDGVGRTSDEQWRSAKRFDP